MQFRAAQCRAHGFDAEFALVVCVIVFYRALGAWGDLCLRTHLSKILD